MSQTVISVENVSKSYQLGAINTGTLYGDLKRWWSIQRGQPDPYQKIGEVDHGNRQGETLWALRDVNFQVQQGEILGIIGRNGAGKSTLLKILSRVTVPTSGEVKVKGRITSLLEVGTGFHPELTGRENIYLNGAIMGMKKFEINSKFDEIVDFSGIEKFIDTPVKRYSSGMYVRLAFAVAAHLEPEILIVDEVLAVGDAEFQKKCLGKMDDVAHKNGRTILFVSHNMTAIKSLCTNCTWLNNGTVQETGVSEEIVSKYTEPEGPNITSFRPIKPLLGKGIELINADLLFDGKIPTNGQSLSFRAQVVISKKIQFSAHMFIYRESDLVMIVSDFHRPIASSILDMGQYTLQIAIPPYLLNPGIHKFSIMFSDYNGNGEQYLSANEIIKFDLEDDGYRRNNRYNLGWGGAVSPILPITINKD